MIYVRLELWPWGAHDKARLLHEGVIYNTGGTASVGAYSYLLSRAGGFCGASREQLAARTRAGKLRGVLRKGELRGFPRLRLGAHDLLFRALRAAFGDRNPTGNP